MHLPCAQLAFNKLASTLIIVVLASLVLLIEIFIHRCHNLSQRHLFQKLTHMSHTVSSILVLNRDFSMPRPSAPCLRNRDLGPSRYEVKGVTLKMSEKQDLSAPLGSSSLPKQYPKTPRSCREHLLGFSDSSPNPKLSGWLVWVVFWGPSLA